MGLGAAAPSLVSVSMNDPVTVIRHLYQAFAAGDVPTVLATLSADVQWTEAEGGPYGGTWVGPQAVLDNVFMKLASEWQDYSADAQEFICDGDTVVVLGEYSATYKLTRKPFRAPFAHVWQVLEGRVVRFRQFTDTHLQQLPMQSNLRLRQRF